MSSTLKNFAHIDLGDFSQVGSDAQQATKKNFFKEKLGLTGMEISVTVLPAGGQSPFLHSHKQNEELYVVVEGRGQMQLDSDLIDVTEGSMINVLPRCIRGLRANPDSQLVYLCIQAKTNSLEQYTKSDGIRHDEAVWIA